MEKSSELEGADLRFQELRRERRSEQGRRYWRKLKSKAVADPNLLEGRRRLNRERMRRYYRNGSEEYRRISIERSTAWRKANLERARERERRRNRVVRLEVLGMYGGCCACCGVRDHEFLAIDHVNGGGNKHRKSGWNNGGITFYRKLKASGYPGGYRVLCHNCNMAKGIWKRCPHETGVRT